MKYHLISIVQMRNWGYANTVVETYPHAPNLLLFSSFTTRMSDEANSWSIFSAFAMVLTYSNTETSSYLHMVTHFF